MSNKDSDISQIVNDTRAFWDSSPCDGQDQYSLRRKFRYDKEPWLEHELKAIAKDHHNIVEVGCGQGTDGVTISLLLPETGQYLGLDLSPQSIDQAQAAALSVAHQLKTKPTFRIANALNLSVADNSLPCVISIGVLHHTGDTQKAIDEIYRALEPGGSAIIYLYRTLSPKLLIAHCLRKFQKFIDLLTNKERSIYTYLKGRHGEATLGTMLLECFGVPVLESYSAGQMRTLFSKFDIQRLRAVGNVFPSPLSRVEGKAAQNLLGVYWRIDCRKPLTINNG